MSEFEPISPITPARLAGWLDAIGMWYPADSCDNGGRPKRYPPAWLEHFSPSDFGPGDLRDLLAAVSTMVARIDELEAEVAGLEEDLLDWVVDNAASADEFKEGLQEKRCAKEQARKEHLMKLLPEDAGPGRATCCKCDALLDHAGVLGRYKVYPDGGFFVVAPMLFWCDDCRPKAWPADLRQGHPLPPPDADGKIRIAIATGARKELP